jgi:hypothetical protein
MGAPTAQKEEPHSVVAFPVAAAVFGATCAVLCRNIGGRGGTGVGFRHAARKCGATMGGDDGQQQKGSQELDGEDDGARTRTRS